MAKLVITERQQVILREIASSRMSPKCFALRAEMILEAFDGGLNAEIAEQLDCERHTVGVWRRRWKQNFDRLIRAECCGRPGELRRTIEEVLSDQKRAGRHCRIQPDQVALIIAVACEPPEKSGRPISHWTHAALAEEVIHRRIVPAISARHVGRFLKDSRTSATPITILA